MFRLLSHLISVITYPYLFYTGLHSSLSTYAPSHTLHALLRLLSTFTHITHYVITSRQLCLLQWLSNKINICIVKSKEHRFGGDNIGIHTLHYCLLILPFSSYAIPNQREANQEEGA